MHGDDFVCLSDNDGLKTHKLFKSKNTATDMGTLEFEESDGKSLLLFVLVLRRKRRGSAQTRAHYRCWNVHGLKKSQHTPE